MSLNKLIRGSHNQMTSKTFEIFAKSLDADNLYVDENCIITNKDKSERMNFVFESKKEPNSVFINKDDDQCDFQTLDNLLPYLENIDREETETGVTRINGDVISENVIVKTDTGEELNLKDYIDDRINYVLANVGGKVDTLLG